MDCETKLGWRTAAACAVVLAGCWQSYQEVPDGGATIDADVIHDGDGEADLGADVDVGDAGACDGAWRDPTTGYLWENPASDATRTWDDAMAYCDALSLCGYSAGAWHLPNIDELRSLIRGCPDTMPDGACGVTASCVGSSCYSESCMGCEYLRGPGPGSYYWDAALGDSPGSSWSSSSEAGAAARAWFVLFTFGMVNGGDQTLPGWVRCVHTGP